jgi:hypothetical protein
MRLGNGPGADLLRGRYADEVIFGEGRVRSRGGDVGSCF